MRKIVFPEIAAKPCDPCKGAGKIPQPLKCHECGADVVQQADCRNCEGLGKVLTKPSRILFITMRPTLQEQQQGKGVDWEKYVVYHPIAQGLKDVDETLTLHLSNEQWEALAECIKRTNWQIYDEDVFAILNAVMDAPDIDAAQAEELNREQRRAMERADGQKEPAPA